MVRMWVKLKTLCVCGWYTGGLLVMDVIWRRTLCKYDFCSELGKGATSEAGKYLLRPANVWWGCSQYFVITSCG